MDREVTICPDPNESSPALPTPEVKAKDKKAVGKKGVPSLAISTPIDMVTYDIYIYVCMYVMYVCMYCNVMQCNVM